MFPNLQFYFRPFALPTAPLSRLPVAFYSHYLGSWKSLVCVVVVGNKKKRKIRKKKNTVVPLSGNDKKKGKVESPCLCDWDSIPFSDFSCFFLV